MAISRTIARPMLASIFFVGATSALKNGEAAAARARKVTDKIVPRLKSAGVPIPENPATLVQLNAATQLAAAAALATGRAPRLSAAVLAGTLVPSTLAGYPFWDETDPEARQQQKLHFFQNVSVLGGLVIAGFDTEGKPGVLWRTRHGAKSVAREGRHFAREKALETKLAAKSLT